jgi:hypothetical protein
LADLSVTVEKLHWENPHVRFTAGGQEFLLPSAIGLTRNGWKQSDFSAGTQMVVTVALARPGALRDGSVLRASVGGRMLEAWEISPEKGAWEQGMVALGDGPSGGDLKSSEQSAWNMVRSALNTKGCSGIDAPTQRTFFDGRWLNLCEAGRRGTDRWWEGSRWRADGCGAGLEKVVCVSVPSPFFADYDEIEIGVLASEKNQVVNYSVVHVRVRQNTGRPKP